MADQSDVENALCDLLRVALSTFPATVFRGWPITRTLDEAAAAGQVLVTVLPVDGAYRLTTRFLPHDSAIPAPVTLSTMTRGTTVTFGGVAAAGQVAGIGVDGAAYAYRVTDGDTPASVAANIAVLVRADRAATLDGASVTLPAASRVVGRAVADTAAAFELRRQEQDFRVTIWCAAPDARDAVASAADVALAATPFLPLHDGVARMRAGGGATSDEAEVAGLYRRDITVRCEYATTMTRALPAMLFGTATAGERAATA